SVRHGHNRNRPLGRRRARYDHRRRRRFDCRRAEGGGQRTDYAYLHRGRRVARVPGRPHAAGCRGAERQAMRTPFIAGNWKMFKTVHDAVLFAKELRSLVKDVEDVEIVVAPPFTALHAVAEALRNANVGVAAQDLYWEQEGAFTGEVSAGMIREAGAEYA